MRRARARRGARDCTGPRAASPPGRGRRAILERALSRAQSADSSSPPPPARTPLPARAPRQERYARKSEAEDLKRVFHRLDSKGDNKIDVEELMAIFAQYKHKVSKVRAPSPSPERRAGARAAAPLTGSRVPLAPLAPSTRTARRRRPRPRT